MTLRDIKNVPNYELRLWNRDLEQQKSRELSERGYASQQVLRGLQLYQQETDHVRNIFDLYSTTSRPTPEELKLKRVIPYKGAYNNDAYLQPFDIRHGVFAAISRDRPLEVQIQTLEELGKPPMKLDYDHVSESLAYLTNRLRILKFNPFTPELALATEYDFIIEDRVTSDISLHKTSTDFRIRSFEWLSPNLLLFGKENGSLKTIDLRSHKYQTLSTEPQDIVRLASDKNHIALGTNQGLLKLYDIRNTKEPFQKNSAHAPAALTSLVWENSYSLLSGGGTYDGTIQQWHLNSDKPTQKLKVGSQVTAIHDLGTQFLSVHGFPSMGSMENNYIALWRKTSEGFRRTSKLETSDNINNRPLSSFLVGTNLWVISPDEQSKDSVIHEFDISNQLKSQTRSLNEEFKNVSRIR